MPTIAVDRDFVYWADPFDSTVHKVPKSGGADALLGTGARSAAASIAVDDACVYWIDGSNELEADLVRVAK